MPSELQDRIAVAIYEADPDKSWSAWGGLTRREQSGYMQTALAVMKAMREPTEVMRAAAPLMPPSFYSAAIDAEIAAAEEPSHG